MSDVTTITIFVLLGINLLTMWRCDILSRRIDTVHKRITLNNRMNGLKSGGWDDEELATTSSDTPHDGKATP